MSKSVCECKKKDFFINDIVYHHGQSKGDQGTLIRIHDKSCGSYSTEHCQCCDVNWSPRSDNNSHIVLDDLRHVSPCMQRDERLAMETRVAKEEAKIIEIGHVCHRL